MKHIICFFLIACFSYSTMTQAASYNPDFYNANTYKSSTNIEEALALPFKLREQLDKKIAPIRNNYERAQKLHNLLFSESQLAIRYDFNDTHSVEQTFITKRGNCLSLAALVVASARYVKLKAKFQTVDVTQQWEREKGFYIVPGHVNAAIEISHRTLVFEFIAAYQETSKDRSNSEVITDNQFYAEYFNNLAVNALRHKKIDEAITLLHTSLEFDANLDTSWSNLGVMYKHKGNLIQAEKNYRHALKLNAKNLSSLTNLYILLNENNRRDEVKKISKKIIRYSKKNPYYLAKTAESDLQTNHISQAQKHIKKAIKLQPKEADFYHILARSYYLEGKKEKAIDAMEMAKELSTANKDNSRFNKKIHIMEQYLASGN